jgi:sphinganine-1-phosphate aldolase
LDKDYPIHQITAEVISFVQDVLGGTGNPEVSGKLTTGIMESVSLGLAAHKEFWYREYNVTRPEIVLPQSASPVFWHSAEILDIKVREVTVDVSTGKFSLAEYKKAINSNTVCIVGSIPDMCFGGIDPIGALSQLAKQYRTGLFIDASVGSFGLNLFAKQLDLDHPLDLTIENLTAYVCNTRFYGVGPKACSALFFAKSGMHQLSNFVKADHLSGTYFTTSMSPSTNAPQIAATWDTMVTVGKSGYRNFANKVFDTTKLIVSALQTFKSELKVIGDPKVSFFPNKT